MPFLILAGVGFLAGLVLWEDRRERLGLDRLVDTTLLRIPRLRAGLLTLVGQQLVLMGTFFVLPVYLQVVLGLDAFETGKRLLPLSAAMLVAALAGPRIAGRRSPRTVAQFGLVAISIGAVVMMATLDVNLNETGFKISLVLFGIGAGLLASQLGNVIMSSVDPSKTSETGGLQGTAQNLGASIGTAFIGAVLIVGLINGFNDRIADNQQLPQNVRDTIAANTEEGIDIVPVSEAKQRALSKGVPEDQADQIASAYGDAELVALKESLGAVAVVALLSLWFTRRLPTSVDEPEAGRGTGRLDLRHPQPRQLSTAGKAARGPNRRKWPEKAMARHPVKGPWECRGIPGSDGHSSPRGSRTRSASSCFWSSRPMSSAR